MIPAAHRMSPNDVCPTLLWLLLTRLPKLLAIMIAGLLLNASIARASLEATPGSGQLMLQRPGWPPVAALLQHLFQNRLANVAPGEAVSVRLEFVQPVEYAKGLFSLRLPMTLTPRYIPGISQPRASGHTEELVPDYLAWHVATDQVPDGPSIAAWQHAREGSDALPLNPVSIAVQLDAGVPLAQVDTPSHAMRLTRDGSRYALSLARGISEMDRDFVLRWSPATGSLPRAALFTEEVAGDYYGMLLVVPPVLTQATAAAPRELVFVVDTSGSMGGVPLQQARHSLAAALDSLRPTDSFNIIAFDHDYRSLFAAAQPASPNALRQARRFVGKLVAGGGTEMLPPLQHALAQVVARRREQGEWQGEGGSEGRAEAGERLRQVVFLTDGAVGNEQAIIDMIAAQVGSSRLFTVGIGSAPNSWFLRKAAQLGRGRHLHIGDTSEVSERIESLQDLRYTGVSEGIVRASALAVALQHQLLSPYTSFVAVEEQISRPAAVPLRPEAVRNTRPRGQDPQGFAYPQTATTAGSKLFFACLLLFVALLFWVMRGPELDHVADDSTR